MSEADQSEQTEVVQTDHESQEFGAQHGQDITGHETGSSSPEAEDGEESQETGEGTGAGAGEYS